MKIRAGIFCILWAALFAGGACDPGDKDIQEIVDAESASWLVRVSLPDSRFKPADLEEVIDSLVDEFNSKKPDDNIKLGVIPKHIDGYFAPVVLGANRAVGELGGLGIVIGPVSSDENSRKTELQIDYMQSCLDTRYKGVGLAPMDSSLVPEIDAAVDNGLTVITFDSDEPASKRHLYVGTNNTEAGRKGASTLLDLLGEKTGTALILGEVFDGWHAGYERTMGAKEVLENAGMTVIILQQNWDNPDQDVLFMESVIKTASPPVVGMLGLFANSYLCGDAAVSAGVTDDLKIAAFDFDLQTLAYMEQGVIHATHAQRQYYMGYLIPYLLYAVNLIGLEETEEYLQDIMVSEHNIDTGLDVVMADEVEEYKDYLNYLGIVQTPTHP